MRLTSRSSTLAALFLVLAAGAGHADAGETRKASIELSLINAVTSGIFDSPDWSLSVRGGYRLDERWGVESQLTYDSDTGLGDEWTLDLSARLALKDTRRLHVFAAGGAGWFRTDADPGVPAIYDDDSATLHLGLGLEYDLTERLYLRPDLRGRWLLDSELDDVEEELSVSLGWRF